MISKFYKYPSIEGFARTQDFLKGQQVLVQEKLDGSNVAIVRENGQTQIQSRNQIVTRDDCGNFGRLVAWVDSIEDLLDGLGQNYVLYGEFLNTNKLRYEPFNPFVLFDIFIIDVFGEEGKNYAPISMDIVAYEKLLHYISGVLGTVAAPTLHVGLYEDFGFQNLSSQYDSSVRAEGVVFKAFDVPIWYEDRETGERIDKVLPFLYTKRVQETHKEVKPVKVTNDPLSAIAEAFAPPARIEKVIANVRDSGKNPTENVGLVIAALNRDILKEEEDAIKDELFKAYWKALSKRTAQLAVAHLGF